MDTKFYKIVNGNELSDFDLGFRLENKNKKRKENMYKVVSFILSTIISLFISYDVLNFGNDNATNKNDATCGEALKQYCVMIFVVLVGALLISILLLGVYKLTDYIYNNFYPQIKQDEKKEVVDVFYRKIHNQIIAAYSLVMRAIELENELRKLEELRKSKPKKSKPKKLKTEKSKNKKNIRLKKVKKRPISKLDVTYQRDLINMYLSKALYYYDQVKEELDETAIHHTKGTKYDEIIKEIGIDRYEDVNNAAIHGLEKIINFKYCNKIIMDRQQYRNKDDNPYEDYINKAKSLCEAYRNNSYYIKSVNFGKSDSTAKDINKNCEMGLTVISAKEIKEQEQWKTKIDKLIQKMIKDREKRNKKK